MLTLLVSHTAAVSGAGPTTTQKPLEELYEFPGQQDEGSGEAVYDLPSENGGVYSELTRSPEEPPASPSGEYAKFDNPLYDTN